MGRKRKRLDHHVAHIRFDLRCSAAEALGRRRLDDNHTGDHEQRIFRRPKLFRTFREIPCQRGYLENGTFLCSLSEGFDGRPARAGPPSGHGASGVKLTQSFVICRCNGAVLQSAHIHLIYKCLYTNGPVHRYRPHGHLLRSTRLRCRRRRDRRDTSVEQTWRRRATVWTVTNE